MPSFEVTTLTPQTAAVIRADVPAAEISKVFGEAFGRVAGVISRQGQPPTGSPFGFYPRMPNATVAVVAGFPTEGPVRAEDGVEPFELPGGPAITGMHVGPYDTLPQTYAELRDWAREHGYRLGDQMWERYLSDPSPEHDPSTQQTQVVWPVAS